jgi:hypothetical protein
MSPLTTLRLALAGNRSDRARMVLTAVSPALGTLTLLAAATVLAVTAPRAVHYTNQPNGVNFYERAYQLVGYAVLVAMVIAAAGLLVALADGVLARKRTLASLIATGTPRAVLARALSWQVLAPVVPAVALSVPAGILLPRFAVPGTHTTTDMMEVRRCTPLPGDPADACQDVAYEQAHGVLLTAEKVPVTVHMPWEQLGLLAGGAIAATVVITLIGLLFLRMSTRIAELRTS